MCRAAALLSAEEAARVATRIQAVFELHDTNPQSAQDTLDWRSIP